jgi:RimJ/RimL family protein N-acetyltransferase
MFAVTDRLLLRPGWADDAPALHAAFNDEAVTMTLASAPWPYRLEDAQAFLGLTRGHGDASFLIFDRTKGSNGLIGGVGIHDLNGEPEIGYWIARAHWGKGYATEAARAVVKLAKHSLRYPRLVSGHFTHNPRSGAVLRKIGFKPTGQVEQRECRARGEKLPCVLFALDLAEGDTAVPAVRSQQMQMMQIAA